VVDASVARAWYRVVVVTATVLALDQVSKALVRGSIDPGSRHRFLPAIDLVNVRNRGIAFGLFSENATLLTALTAAALALLLFYFARHTDRPLAWLPTGLLLGGALGNMFDRLHRGAVTDFIDVPLWPSFNVADMAITFGVLSLLYVIEQRTPSAPRHAGP